MASVLDMALALGREDVDVYDDAYDDEGAAWGTYDGGPRDEAAVYRAIMAGTRFVKGVPEPYGVHFVADVSGFVRDNLAVLGPFSREYNGPGWHVDADDDGLEAGIATVHHLMLGGYPADAYAWLARAWGLGAQ